MRHAIGENVSAFDAETARNDLLRLGFFREIELQFLPGKNGPVLQVAVDEKWTLIPLPVVSNARGITTFGGILLDTNLLGYGKTVFAGALGSNRGWESFAGYLDRSVLQSHFRGAVNLRIGDRAYEYGKSLTVVTQRYRDRFQTASAQLGYEFHRGFLFGAGAEFQNHERLTDAESYNDSQVASARMFFPGIYLQIDRVVVRDFYREGWSGMLRIGPNFIDGNAETLKLTGNLRYTTAGFSDHAFGFSARGAATQAPAITEDRIGGAADSKTIPLLLVSADVFLGGTVFYEVPFARVSWAVFTVQGFFEAGMFDNDREIYMQVHYGPGLGARMYLNKLAIPALGIDAAYAMQSSEFIISGALGLTF